MEASVGTGKNQTSSSTLETANNLQVTANYPLPNKF